MASAAPGPSLKMGGGSLLLLVLVASTVSALGLFYWRPLFEVGRESGELLLWEGQKKNGAYVTVGLGLWALWANERRVSFDAV